MIHFEQQRDAIDCGPSCLAMVAEHYGQKVNRNQLRECCALGKGGVSLLGIFR
ncbi:cysteine peptidase family C39 domain-containing protein [Porphyromonas endodontalis]|uniref:cysteine peptidase family C39 domain-containing protein n=1 Tax=Porphyromonas endodontalis TaxID=28124 RepID=UPI00360B67E8